ncbi:MAG: single-stranded DNA-binding protein [Marvinbryantia sp.]|uniref:single-stranded DNA-binding protein n=1 Tax=Marvinbryantia sp. TaxID=2496532 RepID=UPI00399AAEA8
MNKAVMMGRLVKDPEVRYVNTKKGEMPIANFRIAVNRRFVKEDGVDTDFFSCSAFGRLAEFVEKFLLQGVKVIISGTIETESYKNREGEQVYGVRFLADDIDFAESKRAFEERMNAEAQDDRGRQSSGRSTSSRERNENGGRRSGGSKRSDEYEDERDADRDSGRRSSGSRNSGGRSSARSTASERGNGRSSARSAASERNSGRGRNVDDEYMEMDEAGEELDFD